MTVRRDRVAESRDDSLSIRILALGGVGILTASYVTVLQSVTAVVGGTQGLFVLVGVMAVTATVFASAIDLEPRTATTIAIAVSVVGFAYYVTVAGLDVETAVSTVAAIVTDTMILGTGTSILRMEAAGAWTLGFVPGPVFLSWYLALRRHYVSSVIPGGFALVFLVLTGDASIGVTVLGTSGAIATVVYGEFDRQDHVLAAIDGRATAIAVGVVVAIGAVLVLGASLGYVSDGVVAPFADGDREETLEGSLAADDEATIEGSIDLSSEVRFTVHSERESVWRTGVYDRFTGDRWIRTGSTESTSGRLTEPPGESETVNQTIVVEDRLESIPTAPHPVEVGGDLDGKTSATSHGQFQPDGDLREGTVYSVESRVVDARPDELRRAGTDYPESVTDTYLQRPEDTSSAFDERIDEIVEDAQTPYDKALAIEAHLRESKAYSLSLTRPEGNVAEAFLLEMDEGYCVYFATTMTQMLRAEEIPARYVTGYTSGQQTDDNEWTVRGLNAHAWVEVYVPDHGWVEFDPTPSSDRDAVHDQSTADGDADGAASDESDSGFEKGESNGDRTPGVYYDSPYPYPLPADRNALAYDRAGEAIESDGTREKTAAAEGGLRAIGRIERAVLTVVMVVVIVFGAQRNDLGSGLAGERLSHPSITGGGSRSNDVDRAYRRLESLLERRYRPRLPTETSRSYLESLSRVHPVDARARRVQRLYERSTYGDGIDRAEATEAVALVESLRREALPVVGRLWR